VGVTDHVDVGARQHVEPDVRADAREARVDVRAARPELEHARLVELVDGRAEVVEDGVVRVIGTVALERSRGEADEPDQRGAAAALERVGEGQSSTSLPSAITRSSGSPK
jgi:hypothetical protein